jgi:FkbM family methyltransferase
MFSFLQFLGDEDCSLTILDIGASFLEAPNYQPLVDRRQARIVGFEPDPEACRRLNEIYGLPHRFFPCFVGDGKVGTYYQTNWGPTGSLLKPNTPLLEKFQLLAELVDVVAEHPVLTRRLDDIPEIGDVDFLKIDVQGAELGIFGNASRVLADALLIQTEINFVESYLGMPMFSDIDAFLRQNGYQFHDFDDIGSRSFKPLANPSGTSPNPLLRPFRQKLWADAFYVKDWMSLDRLAPSKLKKFATLLHDIVASYDLAHLVLCELDRQTGSDIAARYLERLLLEGCCSVERDTQLDANFFPVHRCGEASGTDARSATARSTPDPIVLKTRDGISISVPASLKCISTYVLLEQEQWFERELGFVLRWLTPGMNAIDIGANVGVYCLPMAHAVRGSGRVFAFEPGADNRRHLEASRLANDLDNLDISACALADAEKQGWLQIADSGELNSLSEGAEHSAGAECVRVSALDIQEQEGRWPAIDFVKIDAEGQEARIVAGGRGFFARHSPLIMYEINHAGTSNSVLRWVFEALGYHTYRLLGDATCLVPVGSDECLDSYELNLFAAKPDRAGALTKQGLLVDVMGEFALTEPERERALAAMLDLPFARWFEFSRSDVLDCPYADALLAYAASRFAGLSPARRYSGLRTAFSVLQEHCHAAPTAASLASFARAALDLGLRTSAVEALGQLVAMPVAELDQPFFPPCSRYDRISLEGGESDWFVAASNEQLELCRSYSSCFAKADLERLKWLCSSPFVSAELVRRLVLAATCGGMDAGGLLAGISLPQVVGPDFLETVSRLGPFRA